VLLQENLDFIRVFFAFIFIILMGATLLSFFQFFVLFIAFCATFGGD